MLPAPPVTVLAVPPAPDPPEGAAVLEGYFSLPPPPAADLHEKVEVEPGVPSLQLAHG